MTLERSGAKLLCHNSAERYSRRWCARTINSARELPGESSTGQRSRVLTSGTLPDRVVEHNFAVLFSKL